MLTHRRPEKRCGESLDLASVAAFLGAKQIAQYSEEEQPAKQYQKIRERDETPWRQRYAPKPPG